MKRLFAFVCVMLVAAALFCGCTDASDPIDPPSSAQEPSPSDAETPESGPSDAETPEPVSEIEITDMIGRTVNVKPGSYKRVVCIGAGALRMYSYVGDVALLAGVEDIDNLSLTERPKMFDSVARPYVLAFGETFKTLPSVGAGGPNAQAAEAEKILGCAPDIVISEYEDVEKEDALASQLGIPVVTLRSGPDAVFDEAFAGSLRLLGTIFGREDRAEALISFIEAEKEAIERAVSDVPESEKPSVYIGGLGNWGTTNHLMTAENYVSFRIANVKNAVSGLSKSGIQPIEAEAFVTFAADADLMILDAASVKNILPLLKENPSLFEGAKPFADNEVYLEMAYNAYYTNYEIALVNTWFIAKTVYPDRFAEIDIKEKTDEVTRAFLGKPLADEIYSCPQSYGGYQKIDVNTFFSQP